MSDRDIIRRALHDAIDWRRGLLDAYNEARDDPEYAQTKEVIAQYRAVLKRRYQGVKSPIEKLDDKGQYVGLDELREMAKKANLGDAS